MKQKQLPKDSLIATIERVLSTRHFDCVISMGGGRRKVKLVKPDGIKLHAPEGQPEGVKVDFGGVKDLFIPFTRLESAFTDALGLTFKLDSGKTFRFTHYAVC